MVRVNVCDQIAEYKLKHPHAAILGHGGALHLMNVFCQKLFDMLLVSLRLFAK